MLSSARLGSWVSPCCQLQPKSHLLRLNTDSKATGQLFCTSSRDRGRTDTEIKTDRLQSEQIK